jgi:hypothetical protein
MNKKNSKTSKFGIACGLVKKFLLRTPHYQQQVDEEGNCNYQSNGCYSCQQASKLVATNYNNQQSDDSS